MLQSTMARKRPTDYHGILPYCKRTSLILVLYFLIFHLPGISSTSSQTSTPCRIIPNKSRREVVIIKPNWMESLCTLRGGGNENYNRKYDRGSPRIRKKLASLNLRRRQASFLVGRFLKVGINNLKHAAEPAPPKTSTTRVDNRSRNTAKVITTRKNFREKKSSRNIRQKYLKDPIEVRNTPTPKPYSPFKMYSTCVGIVSLWMLVGTFFYSYTNEWPIPQSFFYAVDAGMSIGFCTDVAETKLTSKAFTIVYIILGASVVGGALALFIQDIVEGVVARERKNNNIVLTNEYELMVEEEAFEQVDVSHSGTLTKDEFVKVLKATSRNASLTTRQLSEDDMDVLWTKFDRVEGGAIRFEEFTGTYRGIEGLIDSLHATNVTTPMSFFESQEIEPLTSKILRRIQSLASSISSFATQLLRSENRIYFVFLAWVFLGITWGMMNQGWDPITATHFAISALATGGLTAPPVNSNGILPAHPAIFCGCYCLFGIPLMAITFAHFARALVSDHVAAMEKWALTRPITPTDYEMAKQYLMKAKAGRADSPTTKSIFKRMRQQETSSSSATWRGLRLSDFIVLQILRQGRISVEAINILRKEFECLDTDKTGWLTLEQATNLCTNSVAEGCIE